LFYIFVIYSVCQSLKPRICTHRTCVRFIICASLKLHITIMIHFETKDWTVIVNNSNTIYRTNNHLSPEITEHKKTTTYDVGNSAPCFGQAQNWGGVKLINVIIILPTYNSISITGYNENRVFSYFLLQSAVFCTSLFVPLPVFFWQLCLSSVYGFFNNTFSNFKRFLHLHFELSGRKISKYNSNVVV
jgi:hypothetical protein